MATTTGGIVGREEGASCGLCGLDEQVPAEFHVYGDPEWHIFVHPEYTRPGCLWIMTTSHVEGVWGLTDSQAASFGPIVRATSAALREAGVAEKVYVVSFGENHSHFHALIIARPDGQDGEERGIPLLSAHLATNGPNPDESASMAARVRESIRLRTTDMMG